MAATAQDVLATLQSIDNSLKTLVAHFGAGVRPTGSQTSAAGAVASDGDLDGKYGNEKVRFDPRDWTGDSFKGRLFNECPPAYLDLLAGTFDFFAEKNEASGEKTDKGVLKFVYDRRSAARARGWAARLRAGWKPSVDAPFGEPVADAGAPLTDDQIPF